MSRRSGRVDGPDDTGDEESETLPDGGVPRAPDPAPAAGPSLGATLGVVGLFVAVQVGALAFAVPFVGGGSGAVEDPGDPTFGLVYLVGVLAVSGVLLVAVRRGATWLLRGFAVFAAGLLSWFVLAALVPPVFGTVVHVPALLGALGLVVALVVHPEWYVINAVGVLTGVGAAGIVGVTLGPLPVLVLLVALSAYDAVAVYGTGHMGALAGGAVESRAPVLFVVPGDRSFSYLDDAGEASTDDRDTEATPDDDTEEPRTDGGRPSGGRDPIAAPGNALLVGIGDAVMPTMLAVTAVTYLPAPRFGVPLVALSLPALGAALGTLVGLAGLMIAVRSGRAHAGLPPLNGGAIAGYLLGAVAAGVPLAEALGVAPYL